MPQLDSGGGGGGGSGGDGGGSTSGGGSGGDGFTLPAILRALVANPQAVILGAIITALVTALEEGVVAVLDALTFVFVGSRVGSTAGAWGIADLPVAVGQILVGVGADAGGSLLGAVSALNQSLIGTFAAAGPLAPALVVATYGFMLGLVVVALERLARVVLDLVPGAGGLV